MDIERLDKIKKKIQEITKGSEYIYRGESEHFEKKKEGKLPGKPASSSLYRAHQKNKDKYEEDFSLTRIEKDILKEAKVHFPSNTLNIDMLTELQHYGGKTTLIDFSFNPLIALFFACNERLEKDGEYKKDGRLILLKKDTLEEVEDLYTEPEAQDSKNNKLLVPKSKDNRIIFQNSVFVHAPQGYLKEEDIDIIVIILKSLKEDILSYLQDYFNIHPKTIYNDLQSFIANKKNYQNVATYFYKGFDLTEEGKYQEAIKAYDKAIKINPKDSETYNNKGLALGKWGKYQEAIDCFDQALKINPKESMAYNGKGLALVQWGRHQEAIDCFDQAIKINPKDNMAYNGKELAFQGKEMLKKGE